MAARDILIIAVKELEDILRIGLSNLRDWLNILDMGTKYLNMEQCKPGGFININIIINIIIMIIITIISSSSSSAAFNGLWLPLVGRLLYFDGVSLQIATCALMRPFIKPTSDFCRVPLERSGGTSELYECHQHTDNSVALLSVLP